MTRRLRPVIVIALMAGAVGYSSPLSGQEGAATGVLELVEIKPEDGSRVTGGTFLVAKLRYKVEPFVKGKYFVVPQFAMTRPGASSSGNLPRMTYDVEAPSGVVTVSIPMSRVVSDESLRKPIELRFVLNKRDDSRRSHTLARSVLLQYIPD